MNSNWSISIRFNLTFTLQALLHVSPLPFVSSNSDKLLISLYNNQDLIKHTSQEKKRDDHQRKYILMFKLILPTSTIRNIWRIVRRKCMLILRLRRLNKQHVVSLPLKEPT